MPQEPLRIAIDSQLGNRTKLSFDDLFEVARQFDVSVEALLWQSETVRVLLEKAGQIQTPARTTPANPSSAIASRQTAVGSGTRLTLSDDVNLLAFQALKSRTSTASSPL